MIAGKRGEKESILDGRYVAVLILLIALFMILYILFVPPEQRQVLLEQDIGGQPSSSVAVAQGTEEVFAVSPGEISPKKDTVQEHALSAVNLFVKTEPKIMQLASSLVVKTALFSRQAPVLNFDVDESAMKRVSLVFSVIGSPAGELTVAMNDHVFFSGELESGARVIEVPLSLVKAMNTLEFRVSHPGLAFWSANKYQLSNIAVKIDFERINAQELRTFVLSDAEQRNLASAQLSYFQVCNEPLVDQTTTLKMYLNDQSAFSGLVRCANTKQTLDLDQKLFVAGKNTLRFFVEKGDFSLNALKVTTQSKEAEFPTYSFVLDSDQMKKLAAGKKLLLQMVFANPEAVKTARVFVGEKNFVMQSEAGTFSKDVASFVQEGTNFVRIVPSNTFSVVSLKVVIA